MSELPAPQCPRYEALDAWRGAACLAVVVFHAASGYVLTEELEAKVRTSGGSCADWALVVAGRGWVGVPLFFVISGYCIAAAADSARRKPHPTTTFFKRRFRRIYPPLWAYLIVTAAAVSLLSAAALPGPPPGLARPLPYPWEVPIGNWVGSLTLTEEWRYHIAGPPRGYFTGQLWTLCYEEQFYIVMGVAVAVGRRWLFPIVAIITTLVFLNVADLNTLLGNRLGVDLHAYRRPLRGFFFDGFWLTFAAGVAVYYRANYTTPIIRWSLDAILLAGLFWAVQYIPSVWDFGQSYPGHFTIAFTAALFLGWSHRLDARIAACRPLAPLRWCGRMCYSLYLVHAPVTAVVGWNLYRMGLDTPLPAVLITVPIGVAASLILGFAFYRGIEKRFLNAPVQG